MDFNCQVFREIAEKLPVHLLKKTHMHAMEEVAAVTKQRKKMEKVTGGAGGHLRRANRSKTAVSLYCNRPA